ncbi:MAG: sensor histidine kinase [Chloroflexota bacterium]
MVEHNLDDITGLQSLSQSEKDGLLRALFACSPGGVAYIGPDFAIKAASQSYAEQLGLPLAQVLGRYVGDVLPSWEEQVSHIHQQVRESGRSVRVPSHRFDFADQSGRGVTYWDFTIAPVYDGQNEFLGYLVMRQEVTEQKRAEDQLQHERQYIAAVLDTIGSLVIVMDLEGRIVLFNHACEKTTGYTFAEVQGKALWDIFLLPEEEPQVRRVFAQLASGQYPSEYENYWLTKDGRRRWVAWSNTALFDNTGKVEYIIGTGIDITERRQYERVQSLLMETAKELVGEVSVQDVARVAVERGRAVLEADSAAIWALDGKYQELHLLHSENISPESISVLARIPLEDDILAAEVVRTGRTITIEDYGAYTAGRPVLGELAIREGARALMVAPLRTRHGLAGVIGYGAKKSGVFEAIEQHAVEILADIVAVALERARLVEGLQTTVRMREEFLAMAAHELKTPLTTFTGYTQLLLRRGGHTEEERRIYKALKAQSDRVSRLVQTMLEVNEIQSGELTLHRGPVDICELSEEAVETIQSGAPKHQLAVNCEQPVMVDVDREHIRLVLVNLLDNAVKYSPKGGPVTITIAAQGREAVVAVRDEGIGIAKEKQTRLFEAFYQVAPMVKPTTGLGLGLYVSAEIVHRHGGRIWAESEAGKGSTFTFTLPLAPVTT